MQTSHNQFLCVAFLQISFRLTVCQKISLLSGATDHPRSGWLGFFRHGREKTKTRQCLIQCGCTRVQSTRLKTPNPSEIQARASRSDRSTKRSLAHNQHPVGRYPLQRLHFSLTKPYASESFRLNVYAIRAHASARKK
jgi:hypothetical protein